MKTVSKKDMKRALLSEKDLAGFGRSELLGIAIMIIPFMISILFQHIDPAKTFWFIPISSQKVTTIRPGLISTACAVAFYAALITRYSGVFRSRNLFEAIVSIVRAFLNCWVIAAIISIVIPTTVSESQSVIGVFFSNPESTLLIIAVLLSWLGMKTIAGYSWVLFIIAAWKHLLIVNTKMNMLGAIFVLTFAISLFLQIRDYTVITEFMQDFRNSSEKYTGFIKSSINEAADDAANKARALGELVKQNIPGAQNIPVLKGTPEAQNISPLPVQSIGQASGGTRIDLDSLDINRDGVVDEKDFIMLNEMMQKGQPGNR